MELAIYIISTMLIISACCIPLSFRLGQIHATVKWSKEIERTREMIRKARGKKC